MTRDRGGSQPLTYADESDTGLRDDGVLAEPERVLDQERRRSPRVSVQRPMTVDFGSGPVDALLADFSASGVGVHLPRHHPEPSIDAEFTAELPLHPGTAPMTGRVVWADTRPGRGPSFGAELVAMSPDAASALHDRMERARMRLAGAGQADGVAHLNGREPPRRP